MRLLHIVTAREYHDWQSATPEVSGRRERWGHLIALAAAHRQWFERALSESEITESGYPESNWTLAPLYDSKSRRDLFGLWLVLNRRIIQSIGDIPEEKINIPCRIGSAEAIPLRELVRRYVERCKTILRGMTWRDKLSLATLF